MSFHDAYMLRLFEFVLDSSLSLTASSSFFKHFFVPFLQGIAASITISNFFLAVLMASLSVHLPDR